MISFGIAMGFILPSCALGLLWAVFNWLAVSRISISSTQVHQTLSDKLSSEQTSESKIDTLLEIGSKIQQGANAFLKAEYMYCGIFCVVFAIVLGFIVNWSSCFTFIIGALTSMLCGYIGMAIATFSNFRTSYQAMNSLSEAFQCAYRAGCVMGFALVSISLAVLCFIIMIYWAITDTSKENYLEQLFDNIAGYGLGGSTVALFGRVGGGIYTKAADVGADLVGKVEHDLPEDSPKNPATIADNVGDNVGDIAGMGADLFGSFAESTCAALVVSASLLFTFTNEKKEQNIDNLTYPLVASAIGILVCILTSFIGIYITRVNSPDKIESTLKYQLVISTVILTPLYFAIASWCLPSEFYMGEIIYDLNNKIILPTVRHPWTVAVCSVVGIWAGLIIGYYTEYMTSHSYEPVREVARSCNTGAATNIIYGLSLGYMSTFVPIICIAVTSYVSFKFLNFYGVSIAALGMLGNLAIGLAIDGYGPISDNAGGISEMSDLGEHVRERTDALDAAGNTTAAIGKGFAIGSAALVSLSLYGGFITRAKAYKDDNNEFVFQSAVIDDPMVFAFLLIGAMLPYTFSAFTMKSVGKAALEMVEEIRKQLRENPGIVRGETEPDFKACIEISTQASLKEMIAPGLLVILTPVIVGLLFGPYAIAGLLPGALVSGVQMAIASANTGGAWDNAKKYIESGQYKDAAGNVKKKGSDEHKAAVIGDTVGDPLKDTSGPALNILIKLMAILSLVLASFICKTGYIYKKIK